MPYITPRNKTSLDPYILRLQREIGIQTKAGSGNNMFTILAALSHIRHIGFSLIKNAHTDAVISAGDGFFMNIARELKRRIELPEPSTIQKDEFRRSSLDIPKYPGTVATDPFLVALAEKIIKIAARHHNYNVIYVKLCNYALTELGPRVLMDISGNADHSMIKIALLQRLAFFWEETAQIFYYTEAVPCKEQQIEDSGDAAIYGDIRKWLS